MLTAQNLGFLIGRWVKERGDEPFAFFSHAPHITGAELDMASGRLAAVMAGKGLGCGSKATLVFRPGKELLTSLLACWKLGVTVSPLDRFISPSLLLHILSVLKPDLFLLDPGLNNARELGSLAGGTGCQVFEISLDGLEGTPLPPGDHSPQDPALCLFTSGSTGLPKGVVLTHSALLYGARNVVAAKKVDERDRVLCVLPLSHLNGLVTTFITPMFSLGSVVYMQDSFSAESALKLIEEYRCTWFSAVPTHYMLMVSPPREKDQWSLQSLKFCRSASAPLAPRVLREFESHYGVPLIETMGTTETAGQIFSNPLPPKTRKPGAVGIPVGFEVRLMGESGKVATSGDQGEIQVRGSAMMSGYLDDAQETAKAFERDWFKTGDIGELDEAGYYYIKGRIKDIAIFCGLNISLRAMEMTVIEKALARDVACKGMSHPLFGETVVMYAIASPGESDLAALAKRLRESVSGFLPNSQALTEVRILKSFPRSSVGKVLKGRLDEEEFLFTSREHLEAEPKFLLASVFGISESEITEELMMGAIPEWDSLGYVSLIAATETVLGRELNRRETSALLTFKGLKAVLSGELAVERPRGSGQTKSRPVKETVAKLQDAGFGSTRISYLIMGFDYCASLGVIDVEELLDALGAAVLPDGNLVMNTFTWRFCKGENYHHYYSRCEVGLLNDLFRRRKGVIRVPHPIYSYAVLGPDAEDIARHECETCWGQGSATRRLLETPDVHVTTFGLIEHKGSQLRANPALHALEEMFRVPYRYFKTFRGQANFGEGFQPYSTRMYVRPLDVTVYTTWRPLAEMLADRGLNYSDKVNRLYSYMNRELYTLGQELLSRDNTLLVKNPEVLGHPLLRAELARWGERI